VPGVHPASCSVGTGVLCRGTKRPGREADYSPLSNAEVKNEWMCTSKPPVCLNDLKREKCTILAPSAMSKRRQCTALQFCPFCLGVKVVFLSLKVKMFRAMPSRHRGEVGVWLWPYSTPTIEVGRWLRPRYGRFASVDVHIMSLSKRGCSPLHML